MTHSLHRQGSIQTLKDDYVVLARAARGINYEGDEPKLRRIAEIVFEEGPVNAGYSAHNATMINGKWTKEVAMASQESTHHFIACFDSREKVRRVLKRLKEEDLGISIVVSGLTDEVIAMAREVGLKPHTINLSLGIRGRKDLLAEPQVLELTTMCGHGLVAQKLVRKAVDDVRAGRRTAENAAEMVGAPCICGIVNITRAARLLEGDS